MSVSVSGVGRRWAGWVALWALAASSVLWGTAALEAVEILPDAPRVEVDDVAASSLVTRLALVLGIVFPLAFLGARTSWLRSAGARRGFLLLGALALLASAWVWTGVPDAGPWWAPVTLVVAVLAVVAATAGAVDIRVGGGRVAGAALALAGTVVAVLGWRGLEHNEWATGPGLTWPMWAALLLGVLLVPLGLLGHRLPDTRAASLGAVLVAGALAVVTLVPATLWLVDLGQLHRHEESETGWEAVLPVLVGTGFLAAADAARLRWWPLAGLSTALGLALGAAAVLRSDLQRFLW